METRANYIAVGVFTVLTVLAAFAFIYWTAGYGDQGETVQLRVRIPGSASGLSRGSLVLFNGVKVGDVRRVYIDVNNPEVAIADTEVDRLTPITKSTRADIGLAGLTGTANIELKGASTSEPNLLDEAEREGTVAIITANPSAVTNLLQTAQTILTRADNVVSQLEGFVGDARQPLTETVENIRAFSNALSKNADGVDTFLANVSSLSKTLENVSGKLTSTIDKAEEILSAVDSDKVASVVDNIDQFSQSLSRNAEGIDEVVANVRDLSKQLQGVSDRLDNTLASAQELIGSVDPESVRKAIANIEQASSTVNTAATDVAKVTSKVGDRADEIDTFIVNAKELAERLNQASVRVDGVLAKVDGLLGSDDTSTLISDASDTLKKFRDVADTLDKKIGTITDGLARFSGQGLRDAEALIRDARRAINRIEQAVNSIERNPQRLLTGGDGAVRQYHGRQRR